jgi:hypothetical protein
VSNVCVYEPVGLCVDVHVQSAPTANVPVATSPKLVLPIQPRRARVELPVAVNVFMRPSSWCNLDDGVEARADRPERASLPFTGSDWGALPPCASFQPFFARAVQARSSRWTRAAFAVTVSAPSDHRSRRGANARAMDAARRASARPGSGNRRVHLA